MTLHPTPLVSPGTRSQGRPIRGQGVLVVGEALVDLFGTHAVAGGAPFNVARTLAALDIAVQLITRVGSHDAYAELLRQSARRYGLCDAGWQTDALRPTGSVQVIQRGAQHQFRIAQATAWDQLDTGHALASVHTMAAPAIVYFGTLAQRDAIARRAIRAVLQATRALRYLDLNLREGPEQRRIAEESLALADWVKVSDDELVQLLIWQEGAGVAHQTWASDAFATAVARFMERFALRRLVVTRGALGYACFDALGRPLAQGTGLRVATCVDTVGAGDGFSAMLLAAHLSGQPLASALALANAYAAQVCTHAGPLPDQPETVRAWRSQLAPSPRAQGVAAMQAC